jgi:hypothetical protein
MTNTDLEAIRERAKRWDRKRSRIDRRTLLDEIDRLQKELSEGDEALISQCDLTETLFVEIERLKEELNAQKDRELYLREGTKDKPVNIAKVIFDHANPHWCVSSAFDSPKVWKIGDPPCLPDRLAIEVISKERRIADLEDENKQLRAQLELLISTTLDGK